VILAYLTLLGANVVYATSYVATRVTLASVPPATLALARLVIGSLVLAHWGIARSTATNAALLIVVEPVALMLSSPLYLGERLSWREAMGAALAVPGTGLVVVNGIPGVTQTLVPHWQGDLLLVLAGLAYASYSLLGRRVLERHAPLGVTARSLVWGAAGILPVAGAEWASGSRAAWTATALAGTLLGAALLGEPLTPFTILGGALIIAGLAVAFGPGAR